jgi:N-acetylmuramoyl-L-alanine amidase
MIVTIVASAGGSGAAAQNRNVAPAILEPVPQTNSQLLVQPLPAEAQVTLPQAVEAPMSLPESAPVKAATLAAMVAAQPQPAELSRELHCLAGAVYFESKSESLAGQLAVGRVIVARSKSGRFPNSYCGVVYQPSQFSFVRGRGMPAIPRATKQWKNAVAIAQIAHSGSWNSPVEGALYFHAAYVSPGWHLRRVGRIDNHVFYR